VIPGYFFSRPPEYFCAFFCRLMDAATGMRRRRGLLDLRPTSAALLLLVHSRDMLVRRATGKRVRCVHVRLGVDTNAQAVHQLTAQPACQ
jgi:hypothetical protein